MRTKESITKDIRKILRRNHKRPGRGIEAFWNAVEDVEKSNPKAGAKLRAMGNAWDRAPFESELKRRLKA